MGILDKSLSKGKGEINLSTFAFLFSEMVRYAQNKSSTVQELQDHLARYGKFVGSRLLDLVVLREKGYKRDTKLVNSLMFIRGTLWKSLFNKEADKLERSTENPCHCEWDWVFGENSLRFPDRRHHVLISDYLIEKAPLVNTFISLPKDKSSLNCAAFTAGVIEAFLTVSPPLTAPTPQGNNFPCKVSAHWHMGTAYLIEFEEHVIARENNLLDSRAS